VRPQSRASPHLRDSRTPSPDSGGMPKAIGRGHTNTLSRTKVVEGSWVHAYLHRKEGDQGNAAYWYGRRESLFAESH